MSQSVLNIPTQPYALPSKGLIYPENNPLSSGEINLKIPTAKQEDILTNQAFIKQGIVLDKFLESIIVAPAKYEDLIAGDKNGVLLAARVLAYGGQYKFQYKDPEEKEAEEITVDLTTLKEKEFDESKYTKGVNEFEFTLPFTQVVVTFKLLTHKDEQAIQNEIKGIQKTFKSFSGDITTTLKHTILAVNGIRDMKTIREFVDTMPMKDSKELRKYMQQLSPGIDMKFDFQRKNGDVVEGLDIPITVEFFWPE
jgi:hypothetical protein